MCAQTIEKAVGPDSHHYAMSLKAAAMHAIRPDLACRAFAEQGRPKEKIIVDKEVKKDGSISVSVIRIRRIDSGQSGNE
jgi:hypothetical protein